MKSPFCHVSCCWSCRSLLLLDYTVWNSVADEPLALLGCGSFPWSGHCRNYIQWHCSFFLCGSWWSSEEFDDQYQLLCSGRGSTCLSIAISAISLTIQKTTHKPCSKRLRLLKWCNCLIIQNDFTIFWYSNMPARNKTQYQHLLAICGLQPD